MIPLHLSHDLAHYLMTVAVVHHSKQTVVDSRMKPCVYYCSQRLH